MKSFPTQLLRAVAWLSSQNPRPTLPMDEVKSGHLKC